MLEKLQTFKQNSEHDQGWRQFYLQGDIKQARLGAILSGVILAALIVNDYQLVRLSEMFYVLVTVRLGIVGVCIFWFLKVGSTKNYRSYDKLVSVCIMAVMLGGGVINATRPDNFIAQVIITGMSIFVVYLVIPNRFLNQFLLSTTMTVGEMLIVLLFLHPTNLPVLFTVFLSLVFANITAIFSAWQLQSYRKKSYEDYIKRKELQETLQQHLKQLEQIVEERTTKLKDAERLAAIGATAGMVGHDLRNPLMGITGATFLAKKALKELPTGEAKNNLQKNLELISEQTVYMDKIIADLQTYAAPLHPKFEDTCLHKLAESVLSTLNIPRGITVECLIDDSFPQLKTDQAYIKRILINLSNNSIQAMPKGGKLTIRATIELDKMTITVEDTGEGISEEMKTKLFTPLVTTKAKGQGFGLAVVKRLTEALGGNVSYESQSGAGTKFFIELPQQASNR